LSMPKIFVFDFTKVDMFGFEIGDSSSIASSIVFFQIKVDLTGSSFFSSSSSTSS